MYKLPYPPAMEERIQTAYSNIRVLPPAGENPVKKILLLEAEVYLDEVGDAGNDPENGPDLRETNERDQLLALHSQVSARVSELGWKRTVRRKAYLMGVQHHDEQENRSRPYATPIIPLSKTLPFKQNMGN
jgi:hypothetical protein